jgi:hypothetical protein
LHHQNKSVLLHSHSERDWTGKLFNKERHKRFLKKNLESKKVFVLLHSQIGRSSLAHRKELNTETKNFILIENKIWKVKKSSYLCTPNHKQGLQTARKRVAKLTHTVTSNGSDTRSLNDGNRQNSKCLISFDW